jgi:hypothetical protein
MRSHLSRCIGFAVAGFLIAIFATAAKPQVDGIEGVVFFNGRDGTGLAQLIPVGDFQVDGKQLSPDTGKGPNLSVQVSKEYFVRFCAGKDGSGTCEEYGEGTHNLVSADFNFIKVWKGDASRPSAPAAVTGSPATPATPAPDRSASAILVYEQKNWLGRSQAFGPGMYRSFRGEFGKINDNQARSIVVTKGFRGRFCAEEGLNFRGGGDCEIHEEGRHNLRFANSISFIEVIDLSDNGPDDEKMAVVLFEDSSQTGIMQGFDEGIFFASKLPRSDAVEGPAAANRARSSHSRSGRRAQNSGT